MNSSSSTHSSPSFNEKSPSSLLPHLDHHTDINSSVNINHNDKTINSVFSSDHHNSSLVNHNNILPTQHLHNQLLQYHQQQRGIGSTSPDCDGGGGGDISDGNSDQGSGVNSGIDNTGGYLGSQGLVGNRLFSRNNNPDPTSSTIATAASMAASLASAASSAITSTSSPSTCHQASEQLQMESHLSSHYGACNPHGIDTILNRRRTEMENSTENSSLLQRSSNNTCITPPETSLPTTGGLHPSLSARLSSSLQANPYFNAANALSQMGSSCKLEDLQAAAAQAAAAGHQRANLYWPGIQGLMSNPNIWRERLALNGKPKMIIYQ